MKNDKKLLTKIRTLSKEIDNLNDSIADLSFKECNSETYILSKIQSETTEFKRKISETEENIKNIESTTKDISRIIDKRG